MLRDVLRGAWQNVKSPMRVVAVAWLYNLYRESDERAVELLDTACAGMTGANVRAAWREWPPVSQWLSCDALPPLFRRFIL